MKRFFYVLVLIGLISVSCSSDKDDGDKPKLNCHKLNGNRYNGGVFKLSETEFIRSLFPQNIVDAYSYRTASQIFEGLLKFDQKDLKLNNAIAESYNIDTTATIYTFKIRKGVTFHDNPCFKDAKGREVTAKDVAYSLNMLCTAHDFNQGFSTVMQGTVLGADEYYAATLNGEKPSSTCEGIEVVDDYTIKIKLTAPNSVFLFHLAGPYTYIFPKESYDKYKKNILMNPVGTGPFALENPDKDVQTNSKIILHKNKSYWKKDEFGNQLPYLDALEINFVQTKSNEMDKFKKKELDMIYQLPNDVILDILKTADSDGDGVYEKYQLQRQSEMATHFLAFLSTYDVFQDINLRKAFAFSVNRKKILDFVLDGEADSPGWNGITPNTFDNYHADKIKGYSLNADSARKYFAKTKWASDPSSFPKLELSLNTEGKRNIDVAEEVQTQLKNFLGIDVSIKPLPMTDFKDRLIHGKSKFFRFGWLADYPHPQAFLQAFYGKSVPDDDNAISYPNLIKYKNSEFDKYYEMGMRAKDPIEGLKYFRMAEQILMDDCPFVVLWYSEGWRMLQPYVKNFPNNHMQFRDFSEVYFDCPEKL